MKITRSQLRRLIKEAMFDPYAAAEQAKSKVPEDMMKNLNVLMSSDDEMNQTMGYDLLDTLGDYDSPTGTGSSYQDIKDFNQEMVTAALDDYSDELGNKPLKIEAITKNIIDYCHFDLLTSGVLDPTVFTHPVPPQLHQELLDAIKNLILNNMGYYTTIEDYAEDLRAETLSMDDLPEIFYSSPYFEEIIRRYEIAIRKLAGL